MSLGAHSDFIIAAYAAATVILGILIVWIVFDYRAQRRILAALESEGVTRRSDRNAAKSRP